MIETIDGHQYEITRDGNGKIVKKEGRDPPPVVASTVDESLAASLSGKSGDLTPSETSSALKLILKSIYLQ